LFGGRCRVGDPAFQQRPRDHALPARRVRGGVHRGRPGRRVPRRRALRTRPVRRGPHLRPPTSCNDTRKWTTMTTTTRSGDPGETADALVARMTREEKLSFVAWGFDPAGMKGVGYLPGVPRLGIAPLRVADGPVGIRLIGEPATALPAPVALACAFDAGLAREYGAAMGRAVGAVGRGMGLVATGNAVRVPL